jgi:hypothetical protein
MAMPASMSIPGAEQQDARMVVSSPATPTAARFSGDMVPSGESPFLPNRK